jgi:hypothetical protein
MYLIVKTHFVLCLLLSNDKFYIHSGGSLEYSFIHSFLYFSVYPYTGKTMDVEIVKDIEYNIVNHTMLSH